MWVARFAITLFFIVPCGLAAASRVSVGTLSPKLAKKLLKIAGPHALDCGTTDSFHPSESINNCALSAFRERKPFFVFYVTAGIDSGDSIGFAGDSKGHLFNVNYSWSFSGWDRVTVVPCPEPAKLRLEDGDVLTCSRPTA